MFGSPIHYCPRCGDWVALDEPFAECAARHGCTAQTCPLAALFLIAGVGAAGTRREASRPPQTTAARRS